MYINKNKKGFGWHSSVSTKDLGLKDPIYINWSFKKGCDPLPAELENDSFKGDLMIETAAGFRKVFPVAKEYNGRTYIEFKILELGGVQSYRLDEVPTSIDNPIEDEDLPWEI